MSELNRMHDQTGRNTSETRQTRKFELSRRRFAFWVGLGLFSLGERLRANAFDDLAAATMRHTEPSQPKSKSKDDAKSPEHWTAAENRTWRWFERENMIDGEWKLTGITTPVHKRTGERYEGRDGYLDESLVPPEVRKGSWPQRVEANYGEEVDDAPEGEPGKVSAARRARHGRPPSKWLRSLNADELRIWMTKIEVPEAGVSGMTFWTHLTRDHSFDPERIEGLTIDEQAKLHAAAHYGY